MMVITIIITCELRSNMNNGFVESLSQILTIHSGDNIKINGKWKMLMIADHSQYHHVGLVIIIIITIVNITVTIIITITITITMMPPEAQVMKMFGMNVFHCMLYTGVLCACRDIFMNTGWCKSSSSSPSSSSYCT